MRICMATDFFYPNVGGVEGHVYNLAQCLLKQEHYVIILTHAYGDRNGIRWMANHLKVYYMPFPVLINGNTVPTVSLSVSSLIRHIMLRERIDIVHGHATSSTICHDSVMVAKSLNLPVVVTDHSLFSLNDLASILLNQVVEWTLKDADAVICVSHTNRENTCLRAKVPPEKISVIPNAVDSTRFHPLCRAKLLNRHQINLSKLLKVMRYDRDNLSKIQTEFLDNNCYCSPSRNRSCPIRQLNIGEMKKNNEFNLERSTLFEKNVIIIVACRLAYRKGIDLLALVIPSILEWSRKIGIHLQIIIAGDGPKREKLEHVRKQYLEKLELLMNNNNEDDDDHLSIDNCIQLVGCLDEMQIRTVMQYGDIFLNTSLTEAFCTAIIEAAASGLWVVSTQVGGVPEVLPSDNNGKETQMMILAKPTMNGILQQLQLAITNVLEEKKLIPKRITDSHHLISDVYSWREMTNRVNQVYRRTIDKEIKRKLSMGKWEILVRRIVAAVRCGPVIGPIFAFLIIVNTLIIFMDDQFFVPSKYIDYVPIDQSKEKRKKEN
ncbi:hypothetical protein SNEBB_008825 [Seison nebaliae]|nr:hypothetical protein SNEBB_008825 [Seison nebaliae]